MRENFKTRLDTIQEIVSPSRAKALTEHSDAKLLGIILSGYRGTGRDGRPLTARDLTDKKLMEIIMEGR